MTDSVIMKYGDYQFDPVPLMNVTKEFARGKNPNELFTFKTKVPDGRYDFRTLNLREACDLQKPRDYWNYV